MDLIKIGKFISEIRKENNLTQEEFGEKLGVTNKTISRYETGTYMPPADILLKISELFDVSVNEILTGKRLSAEEYKKAAEENLKATLKDTTFSLDEKIEYYKHKWLEDNKLTLILIYAFIIILFLLSIYFHKGMMLSISFLLAIFAQMWKNNTMMSYIEKKAYDGSNTLKEK